VERRKTTKESELPTKSAILSYLSSEKKKRHEGGREKTHELAAELKLFFIEKAGGESSSNLTVFCINDPTSLSFLMIPSGPTGGHRRVSR